MKNIQNIFLLVPILLVLFGCGSMKAQKKESKPMPNKNLTAADILGNSKYLALSYGGFRQTSRDIEPTIPELKEDMKILSAMGVKVLRTYNVHLKEAANLLEVIRQLKKEDENFEMYVMLGAWIDCQNAWTNLAPNHDVESEANAVEIDRAVELANQYPEIVKIIAVGNEAMVKWATSYFVQPSVILKWVNHLQELKKSGKLPSDLWITSSDNFASWGGGESQYHVPDLEKLIKAVDYISMHTYPMHDTHYNPAFWGVLEKESHLSDIEKINAAMLRAKEYAISQYEGVSKYMKSLGVNKPIHIGETGWASVSNEHYGNEGSKATDEYKEALFYNHMREWTNKVGMSCFFFEAFDEQWKDAKNPSGSENHFGLFTLNGQAKFALWNLVDQGIFKGLTRNGNKITKTYNGNKEDLMKDVLVPKAMH
ncbi:glycosyl hydrolase family 17 protein [Flavobacterium sp.]|uniref:glycosyl hydrolase family 17 protein n=1 Tax=Flavobacterium sp. TaxID=239 RepID=UPI00286C128D|nr:glycosyl hydrolase family 17 protein [Flavobacterium sp.]